MPASFAGIVPPSASPQINNPKPANINPGELPLVYATALTHNNWRTTMNRFVNKVFHGDALDVLRAMPTESIDAVITDPMYMVAQTKGANCIYDWGAEPGQGDAEAFWRYHHKIYEEGRRVLKPGGSLAWSIGPKFRSHFSDWFGGHRIWGFSRYFILGVSRMNHVWLVQTREQKPIRFPDDNALLIIGPRGWWRELHPCAKSEEEMLFLVRHLTHPGQIVMDYFAGTGSTLVAAQQLDRGWIGCDLSKRYCQIAMKRLAQLQDGQALRRAAT